MINSVSANPNSAYTQRAQNKGVMPDLSRKNPAFGYSGQDNSIFDNIKYGFASITNDLMGLVGFNAILWWLQSKVNGDILIGKINKHYTDKINDNETLGKLAEEMRHEVNKGLAPQRHVAFAPEAPGEAYYKDSTNKVYIGEDKVSALFHELGHAKIENKTTVLRALQRFRGHYTPIALAIYALMSQNRKQSYNPYGEAQEQTFGDKVKNFFSRSSLLVPLIAFSPELITEAMASKYGMKFLKEKVKEGKLPEALKKNIGRSYLACFGTYLFIPVSIILMEALQSSLEKEVHKLKQKRMMNQYYGY